MASGWTLLCVCAVNLIFAHYAKAIGYINPWKLEYNLYYGSGDDIDISKMFILSPESEYEDDSADHNATVDDESSHENDSLKLDFEHEVYRKKLLFAGFDDNLQMERELFNEYPNQNINKEMDNLSLVFKDYRKRFETHHKCFSLDLVFGCYRGPVDNFDRGWRSELMERRKRAMIMNLALAFLVHMRYKLAEIMRYRDYVRFDKRYILGYTFNRLRRLMYDLRKMGQANAYTEGDLNQREFLRQVKVHQMFLRLEVDVRDTVAQIRHIYEHHMDPVYYEKIKYGRTLNTTSATPPTARPSMDYGMIPDK